MRLLGGLERTANQVDLGDAVLALRIHHFLFTREQSPGRIHRHEVGVGAIRDVLHQPRGQLQQRAVVGHSTIEVVTCRQERPCEHEVAQTAVRKIEGPPGSLKCLLEGLEVARHGDRPGVITTFGHSDGRARALRIAAHGEPAIQQRHKLCGGR